jgi:hypothetical protein
MIRKSRIRNEFAFKTVLVVLLKLINDPKTASIKSNLSEELKFEIMELYHVTSMFSCTDVIEKIYTKSGINLLAQCIFTTTQVISKEKYRKLKFAGIQALMGLTQTHDNVEIDDIVLRDRVSQIIFIMLPKIIAVLIEVCQEETIKGPDVLVVSNFLNMFFKHYYKIINFQIAIRALGRILCLILEDYDKNYQQAVTNQDFLSLIKKHEHDENETRCILGMAIKSQSEKEKYFESTTKSQEWIQAAAGKLSKPLEKLRKVRNDPHKKIRFELVKMSFLMLERCYLNIKQFSSFFLENLILLLDDEESEISHYCEESLKKLISHNFNSNQVNSLSLELFNNHLTILPRIVYNGDEHEQFSGLKLLNGFIKFIFMADMDLIILIENEVVLEKFIGILLSCSQLEMDENLIYENLRSCSLKNEFYNMKKPWKKFKNLMSAESVVKFLEVCKNIGKSAVGSTIINRLLDDLSSIEHLVVLNAFLDGATNDRMKDVALRILEEFLDDSYWEMPIQIRDVQFLSGNSQYCVSLFRKFLK